MPDKPRLAELLQAPPDGVFFVTNAHVYDWGAEIVFDCRCELNRTLPAIRFQLVLRGCRDFQWRTYAHLRSAEDLPLPAAVVNVALGQDNHRRPFNLLTDSFAVTVTYSELVARRVV